MRMYSLIFARKVLIAASRHYWNRDQNLVLPFKVGYYGWKAQAPNCRRISHKPSSTEGAWRTGIGREQQERAKPHFGRWRLGKMQKTRSSRSSHHILHAEFTRHDLKRVLVRPRACNANFNFRYRVRVPNLEAIISKVEANARKIFPDVSRGQEVCSSWKWTSRSNQSCPLSTQYKSK